MKKTMLFFLLLAGTATALRAQNYGFFHEGILYNETRPTTTDFMFNFPRPGKTRVNFSFWGINKSSIMMLELNNIKQLEYLPNLDSILSVVKNNLQYLSDSLKQDGIVRRVDYVMGGRLPQIRISQYDNNSKTYTINKNELSDLKIGQDTIRIKFYTFAGDTLKIWQAGKNQTQKGMESFFITLLVNNISDIENFSSNTLQNCIDRLKQEVTSDYVNKADSKSKYSAYFNMTTNKMFSPSKVKYIKYGGQRQELVPNIYSSLQYVNGSFVPSMAAGLRYTFKNRTISTKRLFAMWEPHFFFRRDATTNNLITDRNDFVTLRYTEIENNNNKGFDFVNNVSIGYLVKQQGNWFAPNTIKLGLPGVRSGWLQLEPELFFTGLFKGFSPSLKLTLHYE